MPGFLTDSLVEYIPGPHLALPGKTPADWEKAIFQKHSRSVTELPMQTYMNVIAKREYYGATLFAAKVLDDCCKDDSCCFVQLSLLG